MVILVGLFVSLIILPNLFIFSTLKQPYYILILILIFGLITYLIKESNLIHALAKKHKSNMTKLSRQYQVIFRKRIKQSLYRPSSDELGRFKEIEVTYRPSRIVYICIMILLLFFGGSFVYYYIEKLSYIDAMYLAASTLTRVDYGDIVPKTDAGKLFTIFYILFVIGMVIYGLSIIAKFLFERKRYL